MVCLSVWLARTPYGTPDFSMRLKSALVEPTLFMQLQVIGSEHAWGICQGFEGGLVGWKRVTAPLSISCPPPPGALAELKSYAWKQHILNTCTHICTKPLTVRTTLMPLLLVGTHFKLANLSKFKVQTYNITAQNW